MQITIAGSVSGRTDVVKRIKKRANSLEELQSLQIRRPQLARLSPRG
jgi:hypothetical protein